MKSSSGIQKVLSDKRLIFCSLITGLIFAGTLVVGNHMFQYEDMVGNGMISTIVKILLLALILSYFVAIAMSGYDVAIQRLRTCSLEIIFSKYMSGTRNFFLILWALTFLAWLPGLLAAFPGVYDIDGAFQIMWFERGTISAHHPVLHTYLLGGLVEAGKHLFGSYEAGLLCYSIFQMLCMSGMFAYISKKTCKWLPGIIELCVILSYMILPYHAVLSFTTTKDVLFAGIFAIWVLKTFECVLDKEHFFSDKKSQLQYVIVIFLMCAFRNTGYYIMLFMILFFLVLCRRYWKNILCIGLAGMFVWNLYTGPVYNLLNIQRGSEAEVLSVPMQQLSRVIVYSGDTLASGDKALIEKYIPEYTEYTPRVSDSVKDTFNVEAYKENKIEFLKLWLRVGVAHPVTYVEAFLSNNIGFWYLNMKYPDEGTFLSYIVYHNTEYKGDWPEIKRTSYLPALSEFYDKFTQQGMYYKIPGAFVWYSGGVLLWMLVLGVCMCIYKRRYEVLVPFSILIGLWGTLMLSPVVVFRYIYPLSVSVPVILSMCITVQPYTETKQSRMAK
ncbi:MAG: DUF6020 family protein [Muricomes sp.]